VAQTWLKILGHFPGARIVGCSATPSRLDGRGLDQCFDELVLGPPVRALIEEGWLAGFRCFSHPSQPDLSAVRTRGGDYAQDELGAAMSRPKLLGDAVDHYRRHLGGRPAIVFCVTVAHAEAMAARFAAAGYRAASVDGGMNDDERASRVNGLSDGSVQVLTSCDLISEGFDAPAVAGVLLCRPTKSLNVYLQQVGRALRPKPDGSKAVVLDHAGCVLQHGLPDTPHEWDLHSPKRKPAERSLVKVCKSCFATVPINCRVCPECGTPFPLAEPKALPRAKSGQLVEIRGWAHVERSKAGIEAAARQCRNWSELKALGKYLGFAKGWSYHKARELGWYEQINGMGFTTGFQPRERVA
jgi:superfamily II DNA or RNA helicase